MSKRSKTRELLEFEVRFYENLLAASPDFSDVLLPLGDVYTRLDLHEQALAVDLRLTQLRVEDPLAWYNLACSYALLKRLDESLAALRRSVALGYDDVAYLQNDPDLNNLRQSPQYRVLLESVSALAAPKAKGPRTTGPAPA